MKKHKKAEDEDFGYLNEEESAVSLPMIIGGAVLVVVIIVLCVLLWQLLHQEKPAGTSNPNATMAADTLVNQGMAGNAVRETSSAQGKEEVTVSTKPGDSKEATGSEAGSNSATSSEATGDSEADISSEAEGDGATNSEMAGNSEGTASSESGDQSLDRNQGITMTFRDVEEIVTAKDVTNLRSEPSTTGESTVVAQLKNGETVKRTGINDTTGWSRLEYKGAIVYASGRLLTTDLTAKPAASSQNAVDANTVTTAAGRIITFTPCDDMVSPKMEVNLRLEPSTNQGDKTVHCRLLYGENVHRTGYDDASGWSRVEYDGKVLYVVTSYIFVVEEPGE